MLQGECDVVVLCRIACLAIAWETCAVAHLVEVFSIACCLGEHQQYVGIAQHDEVVACKLAQLVNLCLRILPLHAVACRNELTLRCVITVGYRCIAAWVASLECVPEVVCHLVLASSPCRHDTVVERCEHCPVLAVWLA